MLLRAVELLGGVATRVLGEPFHAAGAVTVTVVVGVVELTVPFARSRSTWILTSFSSGAPVVGATLNSGARSGTASSVGEAGARSATRVTSMTAAVSPDRNQPQNSARGRSASFR
ncbi:hypothetical protein [Amycolatopsis methanolica]|uniref:hypothetical protein n=1 Tax=Amycolatopsis methanolica TaxID=1814 RepID=UPI0012E01B14|nr:hypothetical protein [Amycolatopsis methanolica]